MSRTNDLVARTAILDMAQVSDVDLVALLIAGGTGRRDPEIVANAMLRDAGGDLGRLTRGDILDAADLSPLAKTRLFALREVHRRASLRQAALDRQPVNGPRDAEAYLRPLLGDDVEHVAVLFLRRNGTVLKASLSTIGAAGHSLFDIPGILRQALLASADRIIVAHNHPSGELSPSTEDLQVTRRFKDAAASVGLSLDDHLIFTRHGIISLRQQGSL